MVFPNPDRSAVGISSIPENLRVCDGAVLMDQEDSNSVDAWNLMGGHGGQGGSIGGGMGLSAKNVLSAAEVANANRLAGSSGTWQTSSSGKRTFSTYRGGKKVTGEGSDAFRLFMGSGGASSAAASSTSSSISATVGSRRGRDDEEENVPNSRGGTTAMDAPAPKRPRGMPSAPAPAIPSAVFALASYEGAPVGFGGGEATRVMSNANNALQLPQRRPGAAPASVSLQAPAQHMGSAGPLSFAFRANAQY